MHTSKASSWPQHVARIVLMEVFLELVERAAVIHQGMLKYLASSRSLICEMILISAGTSTRGPICPQCDGRGWSRYSCPSCAIPKVLTPAIRTGPKATTNPDPRNEIPPTPRKNPRTSNGKENIGHGGST